MNILHKRKIARIRDMVAYNIVAHMTHGERNEHLYQIVHELNMLLENHDDKPVPTDIPF